MEDLIVPDAIGSKIENSINEASIDFFDAILNYTKKRKYESRHQNFIIQGLQVLMEFPHAVSASAYLMNEETFEFEHYSTLPAYERDVVEGMFPVLVEDGAVGRALSKDYISFYPEDYESETPTIYYMIIPLVCTKGVIGLVVLGLNTEPGKISKYLLQNCILFIEIVSHKIENDQLYISQQTTSQVVEQKVVNRTMGLAKDNKTLQERLNDLRSNLTMSLPHEIRTPLNEILGYSSILKNNHNDIDFEEVQQMLTFINSSATRLHRLFEQYLIYANLEVVSHNPLDILNLQAKITPSLESVLFNSASYYFETADRLDDLELETVDVPLCISQDLLSKMLNEIVDNSIKYSEKGSPVVIKSTLVDNNMVEICIINEGRGMTKEQVDSVGAYVQFERKIYEQQGNGLGLAIASRIVDLHNGHFAIESEPNKTTKVTVRLPIAPNQD